MTSSFLSAFDGLWRRPTVDYKNGVKSYIVALDTNALLELYRFTPDARRELLHVLSQLKDRLWIPHQVATEYYGRRVDAIKEHIDLYTSLPHSLEEHKRKTLQELNTFAKRCSMSDVERKNLTDPVESAFSRTVSEVVKRGKSFDLTLEAVVSDDPILAALAEILDGKSGEPFTGEEAERLVEEFGRRVEAQRPPGYKDANKRENAHGDFFIWEQLLRVAEARKTPILLVTNDTKEDWIRKEAGLIVGARPELLAEMRERCGVDFLITQLGSFLKIAKEELGASVSESTVAQAENPWQASQMETPWAITKFEDPWQSNDSSEQYFVRMTLSNYKRALDELASRMDSCGDKVATLQRLASKADDPALFDELDKAKDELREVSRLFSALEETGTSSRKGTVGVRISSPDLHRINSIISKRYHRDARRDHSVGVRDRGQLLATWNHLTSLEKELAELKEAHALAKAQEMAERDNLKGETEGSDNSVDAARRFQSSREHRIFLGERIAVLEAEIGNKLQEINQEKLGRGEPEHE